jgi:hypothetical protein
MKKQYRLRMKEQEILRQHEARKLVRLLVEWMEQ